MIDKQIRTLIKLAPIVKKHNENETIITFRNYEIIMKINEETRISYDIWINREHEIINKATRNIVLKYVENYKKKPTITRFKEDMINYERECKLKRIVK